MGEVSCGEIAQTLILTLALADGHGAPGLFGHKSYPDVVLSPIVRELYPAIGLRHTVNLYIAYSAAQAMAILH